ncbi:hypothetical protein [Thiomicrorhabdus arctica]|uniref:hypothetical protein n=1 Tax=Thiomicrorhabdus arctica TaxID=131540 RepID=UPI0003607C46|nr:hypothetical protein [Thiomicrorhabdus arctica]
MNIKQLTNYLLSELKEPILDIWRNKASFFYALLASSLTITFYIYHYDFDQDANVLWSIMLSTISISIIMKYFHRNDYRYDSFNKAMNVLGASLIVNALLTFLFIFILSLINLNSPIAIDAIQTILLLTLVFSLLTTSLMSMIPLMNKSRERNKSTYVALLVTTFLGLNFILFQPLFKELIGDENHVLSSAFIYTAIGTVSSHFILKNFSGKSERLTELSSFAIVFGIYMYIYIDNFRQNGTIEQFKVLFDVSSNLTFPIITGILFSTILILSEDKTPQKIINIRSKEERISLLDIVFLPISIPIIIIQYSILKAFFLTKKSRSPFASSVASLPKK